MLLRTKRPVRAGAAIAMIALTSILAAACTSVDTSSQSAVPVSVAGTSASDSPGGASSSSSSAARVPVALVTASPQLGDDALSPVEPVTITVAHGIITALSVTNPEGAQVAGTMSPDKTSWTLGEPLGYDNTYSVSGTALGSDGLAVPIEGTYTTVTPVEEITTSISPGDGAVVGVAAPVIVHLGYDPADKDLIEKHVTITTTPHVEGAWAWIQHDGDKWPSLDWRPKQYWPSGTAVHVESNIYGLDFGEDYFGGDNVTSDFTIGRNQVVLADANAHNIVVQRDGVTVATYDASFGSGDEIGDPNRVTRSGIHVVSDMQETVKMSNPAYGYTNITEHWAVRISANGEFIHQNQDTVDVQGVDNVSHGCINLSAESAEAYYASAIIGDPVVVTGTSVQLSAADGDVYDWTIPWETWLQM
ncbi:MAG TPA: Ig-like domain-containing protein [Nakamurella sp.]|nr:Ig-like domain-containing protein [Nakamurella sp.]